MASLTGVSVGFLGLGDVGRPVLRRLKARGAEVYAPSRSPALRYKMARDAVNICNTPAEVAAHIGSGIIFMMLSQDTLINAFMEGDDGLLASLSPGALIIDLGPTSPEMARKFSQLVRKGGGRWLEAPALGSEQAAAEGRLTIHAGGEREDFDRALPLLQEIARDIDYLGKIGAGQSEKAG